MLNHIVDLSDIITSFGEYNFAFYNYSMHHPFPVSVLLWFPLLAICSVINCEHEIHSRKWDQNEALKYNFV